MDCEPILNDLNDKEQQIDDRLEELETIQFTEDLLNESIDRWCDEAYESYKRGDDAWAEYCMDKAAEAAKDLYDNQAEREHDREEINQELERMEGQAHHLEEDYCKCKFENP